MKAARKSTLVCLLVLAAGVLGSVWTSRRSARLSEQAALQEVLYIPSPKTVKAMSLGYTGLMADVYWTRVVQYFGNKHLQSPDSYKLLAPLLEITTTLDPDLDVAYQFGGFFLSQNPPEGAGMPDEAIALVKKGIASNPDNWQLYSNLGYIYWMEKKDYKAAAEAFDAGSKLPGALGWMKVMAAAMAQGGNDFQTARTLWTAIYNDSKNSAIKWNAQRRLMCIESDERVMELQRRVDLLRQQLGRIPTMDDLVTSHMVPAVPLDPTGNPYQINSYGEVVVANRHELPFVSRGLPHGEKPEVVFSSWAVRGMANQAGKTGTGQPTQLAVPAK